MQPDLHVTEFCCTFRSPVSFNVIRANEDESHESHLGMGMHPSGRIAMPLLLRLDILLEPNDGLGRTSAGLFLREVLEQWGEGGTMMMYDSAEYCCEL